ncbi:hypothetical protein MKK50_21230 [Methylobacterium sp. J-043]|nr:hypothetical protein [Methylobacterium sp. J-043]
MASIHQRFGDKAERSREVVVNEQEIRHSGAPVPSCRTGATQRALTCAFFCTKELSGSAGAIHPHRRFGDAKNLLRLTALHADPGFDASQSTPYRVATSPHPCGKAQRRKFWDVQAMRRGSSRLASGTSQPDGTVKNDHVWKRNRPVRTPPAPPARGLDLPTLDTHRAAVASR